MTLTAVIADDAPLIREALAAVLESAGIGVASQVGRADVLHDVVAQHRPDVVIVDVRMPPTHRLAGLDAAIRLRSEHPQLGILLLSQHVQAQYLSRLLERGAGWTGYLLKERAAGVGSFIDAVRTIAAGGCCFDPQVVSAMLSRAATGEAVHSLSPRELQVLEQMAQGASNAAICQRLDLGEKTVESHIGRIFARLGLADEPDVNRRVKAVLAYLDAAPP